MNESINEFLVNAGPEDIVNVNDDGSFGSWIADVHYVDQVIADPDGPTGEAGPSTSY